MRRAFELYKCDLVFIGNYIKTLQPQFIAYHCWKGFFGMFMFLKLKKGAMRCCTYPETHDKDSIIINIYYYRV